MFSMWLRKIVLFPLFLLMGVDGDDSAASGDQGPAPASDTILGGGEAAAGDGDPAAGGAAETADGLFTPEEIAAKRESIAAAKAEETRRAALTQEERDAEDKAKADEEAKTKVPEEYADFKIPESMTVDKELLEVAVQLFKKAGLTQELAQEFIDLEAQLASKRLDQWNGITRSWAETAKSDPEIGGANWDKSVEVAQRALNTFGTPELKSVLNQYGIGNHPEMIRLMTRLGNAMREDTIVLPGSKPGDKRSIEDRLYGSGDK